MLYLSNNTHIQIPENLFQAAITAETWGLFFVNKQNGGFAQSKKTKIYNLKLMQLHTVKGPTKFSL